MQQFFQRYRKSINPPYKGKDYLSVVLTFVLIFALLFLLYTSHQQQELRSKAATTQSAFSAAYEGTDYVGPSGFFTGCNPYTYFQSTCYTNTTKTSFAVSPQQLLTSDFTFLANNKGGLFQRVWISLDSLFSCFDATNGFCGYDQQALANVINMLHIAAQNNIKTDLVLFANSNLNHFHFEALDGNHVTMRANYLTALQQFVQAIAADATASSAVAVMDLENEAYYQNDAALQNATSLCGANWGCIENSITLPWLTDMYTTAHTAAPQFNYTVSDVEGLGNHLLSTTATIQNQAISMYPVDVYDIHLYTSTPSALIANFAAAANLPHPWFSGEAGTGNTLNSTQPCYTYTGTDQCTITVETWMRQHLGPDYGAKAVLVESPVMSHLNGPLSQALTPLGQALASILTPTPTSTYSPTPSTLPTPTSIVSTPLSPTITSTSSISDTIPPVVNITSPLNGAIVKHGQTTMISTNTSDDVAVTKVIFYVNNSLLNTVTRSPYATSWSVPGKRNVSYTLKAVAYDVAGLTATSTATVTSR